MLWLFFAPFLTVFCVSLNGLERLGLLFLHKPQTCFIHVWNISDGLKIFTPFSKVLKHMIHTSSGHTQQATSKGHRKRRTSIDTSSPYLLDSRVVASILNVSNKTTRTRTTTRERCLRDALPLPSTYQRFQYTVNSYFAS